MNAENAGAFFCPASPKAPTVGALLHAILGVRAAAKPPWMGLRRSSTGIPHTLKSAKLLKPGIAGVMSRTVVYRTLAERMSKLCSSEDIVNAGFARSKSILPPKPVYRTTAPYNQSKLQTPFS
ncbi:hypothetical protein EQU24_15975 [Methylotuvimicrobium buryatense]|uniref:Uncharacterized protein n=1 Tax=Methylotuvimicrobium buryatense TaxID=95641 RepID=A0A4P9USQ1_METBY|nr:hypothetical protein EQU24_15975 [Methylotuvimicrobium buryatense]